MCSVEWLSLQYKPTKCWTVQQHSLQNGLLYKSPKCFNRLYNFLQWHDSKKKRWNQKSSTSNTQSQGTTTNIGEGKYCICCHWQLYWPYCKNKRNGNHQSSKWCGDYYQRKEDNLIHHSSLPVDQWWDIFWIVVVIVNIQYKGNNIIILWEERECVISCFHQQRIS